MSIFNPWGEIRRLKAQLEAGYETYRIEETQQQAEWAKKAVLLEELERDNAALRRELKEAIGRGADHNFELELKLSEMTAQRNKANNAIKRKDRVILRRDNDIKSLKSMLRELREKYHTVYGNHGEASYNMGKLKVLCTNLKVENHELKKQLAQAVDPRDPKTGRFTKKAK